MKKKMRHLATGVVGAWLVGISGLSMAAPMESVIGLDVHNPGAFIAAVNRYYQSDGATGGVTIWAIEFSGESEISHLAIANYSDYAGYDSDSAARRDSASWGAFVGSIQDVIDVESRLMAVERFREGSGWEGHDAMAAIVMTVTDPAKYAAEFSRLVDSADNPGSVRLMELRFGGQGATHAALISAPSITTLNEYLDELLMSDAYRRFSREVGDIRTIHNVEMLRRVATFGD